MNAIVEILNQPLAKIIVIALILQFLSTKRIKLLFSEVRMLLKELKPILQILPISKMIEAISKYYNKNNRND